MPGAARPPRAPGRAERGAERTPVRSHAGAARPPRAPGRAEEGWENAATPFPSLDCHICCRSVFSGMPVVSCLGSGTASIPLPLACTQPAMDVDRLLAMATGSVPTERSRRISMARRLAGSLSARRGMQRKRRELHQAADAAQRAWHNREVAAKQDFTFQCGDKKKVKGQGKWKQRTSHELLRIAFKPPSQTLASIAGSLTPKASVSFISNVQAMAACKVRETSRRR